ncbi:DUF87 domain-containing protein [Natroniella acetigena]|uniref:ATP-binding protein n=1 Tax=Natroniella acetigena TaxID=52004 RepID=UPI00200A0374|nr:ATP-binding protein [Natroniella acetigena]MCK8827925.1 DUF87 domain-containing protein [Natroniella acetigena]
MNHLMVDEKKLDKSYQIADDFVNRSYLNKLEKYDVKELPDAIKEFDVDNTFRFFKINKLVYDRTENNLDKLANVYSSLEDINASLVMIINSKKENVEIYLGIKRVAQDSTPAIAEKILKKSFSGNFPGSEIANVKGNDLEDMIADVTESNSESVEKEISSVSGIPSLKDDDKEKFVQGIEKLIDAMKGEEFSAVFIADTIAKEQIKEIKLGYEQLYSQLSPFAQNQLTFGTDKSKTITEGTTYGFTETINSSVTKTQSYTVGESKTDSYTENESKTKGSPFLMTLGAMAGGAVGGPITAILASQIVGALGGQKTKGSSSTKSKSQNYSQTEGESKTTGQSKSESQQINQSEAETMGISKSTQVNFENKSVANLLEKIDEQLDRLKSSKDFGMWNTAAYFIAEDNQTAKIAASTFKSLMRGEASSVEDAYINNWGNQNKDNLIKVKEYLKRFHHPLIDLNANDELNLPYVTPGSLLNGRELTIQFGLPVKSITGVTVMETAEFGRNIISYGNDRKKEKINIGKIFHMGQKEDTNVKIDVESLSMHTFITGSTGSGKSNTIYKLLAELSEKEKKFLVIEPAKGEYKEVFGGREDVNVYGTNPRYTDLLKVNPFKFPDDIHVLEHIDRLVEIFNACWPMYAAMPAVLKEAVERAYQIRGWDLDNSICINPNINYPNFNDVLQVLPDLVEESGYSEKVKNDYLGALVTRVRSLTTGLTGRILTNNELDKDKLFNENCIIDLSRIGSVETKSLLMGILFMRLHEERYANVNQANSKLKHVTVLEEAHNLLRRTSSEQSQESSNLQGKSVEMISNAIAEMRSYGEGFIIADQSPNMLDQSVIKNTNTKIILRLPDEADRQLVGKAISLNEEQIIELAKLKTGVGAVYQNDWLEAVLCSIDEYKDNNSLKYNYNFKNVFKKDKKMRSDLFRLLLKSKFNNEKELEEFNIEKIKEWLIGRDIEVRIKNKIEKNLNQYQAEKDMELWNREKFDEVSQIVGEFINYEKLTRFSLKEKNFLDWNDKFKVGLRKYVDLNEDKELENKLVKHLLNEKAHQDLGFKDFYFAWIEKVERGL